MSNESTSGVIGSEPLSASIRRILLERIVSGDILPGERIVESRLVKELKISQSPLREALRDLAAIGLVDIEARRGARVRQPSAKELRDVSEVRSEIDAMAARLAAGRLQDQTIDDLRRVHVEMTTCHANGDYVGMTEFDSEFHRIIVSASGNEAIERVFGQLEPFARTFITLTSPNAELAGVVLQHEDILDALIARDPIRAADRARAHQLSVREAIVVETDAIEDSPDNPS